MIQENMDFQDILRNSRLKATPKRLAMLDILADNPTYLSPEDIWKKMKGRFTNMGLPTVYRNLEYLSKENIIIKIIHPDRKLYYYFCHNTDHHHHFICTSCNKVEDLAFCGMKKIEEEVRKKLKGNVVAHLLQVFGFCKECTPQKPLSYGRTCI
jgi:Fe2+ or Zn2+ uptake regulation protein